MRISVLADNRTHNSALKTEHGLCVFLDTGKIKVMLDTGASNVFVDNASVLGVDLAEVDYVFISHAHKDHAGGLSHLLRLNHKARVIVSSEALKGSFHSSRRGLHDITPEWPNDLMEGRLICADHEMVIDGMRIIPHVVHHYPVPKADSCLYMSDSEGELRLDDFKHEMSLQVGSFLFTGCAHNGLLNILASTSEPVHTVLGGFHLLDASDNEAFETKAEINMIASELHSKYPDTVFYTGHCTGEKVYKSMHQVMGQNLMQFYCGMSLEI